MATFLNQVLDGSSCCECDSSRTSVCDPCGCPQTICLVDKRHLSVSGTFDYSGTYEQNGTYTSYPGRTDIAYEREDGGAWIYKDWASDWHGPVGTTIGDYGYWTVAINKGDTTTSLPTPAVDTHNLAIIVDYECPHEHSTYIQAGKSAFTSIWSNVIGWDVTGSSPPSEGDCFVGECPYVPPPFQYCGCEPPAYVSGNVPAPDASQEYGNAAGNPPNDVSVEYFYPGSGSPPIGGGTYDYGYFEWYDANATYPCRYLADGTGSEPSGYATIWYDGTGGYWMFEETIGTTTDTYYMSEYYGGMWSTIYGGCGEGPLTVSSGPNGGPTAYVNYAFGPPYYYIEVT